MGILGTFSRMGFLLLIITITSSSIIEAIVYKKKILIAIIKSLFFSFIIITFLISFILLGPVEIKSYMIERIDDVFILLKNILNNDINNNVNSSAGTRFVLAKTALILGVKNWELGVGAFQTVEVIYNAIGLRNVSHNTFIEVFLIGGIWGLILLLYYFYLFIKFLLNKKNNYKNYKRDESFIISFILIFSIGSIFLSLTYNFIFWLPLVLLLTIDNKNFKNINQSEV